MRFAETPIAQFLASTGGRALRAVAGIAIIAAGALNRESDFSVVLMIVGLIPLAAGVFDVCLLSPLLGGPLAGERIRAAGHAH